MTEETIFCEALEKKDPTERVAYLDAACAGNPALRRQVEALLRSHSDPGNVLDRPIPALHANVGGPTQSFTPTAIPESGARHAELAILGPPREPGSLGSLDHYEVLEVAGRGGMGVVFKARDTKLQRIVAIKVLAAHLAADGTSRKRFVREAQAAAAIHDTHVVGIHAVNDDGAVPYLVMEFIGGVTLEEQIKANGPPTLKEILRIAMQAAEGLAAAHRQGLIHRDVKPANILLENGVQRVKITDFGLARAGDNASLTQPGMIAGTPMYMSPEQSRGESLDQRSDLFSLGSVLYNVCTGSAAFDAANTMALLKRVREDTPKPIRAINSEIPEWLAAIVDKLLAKDPKDRFQSAAELAALLGEHLARLQHSGAAIVLPATPAKRPNRRRWIAVVANGLLVLSVASVAAYVANMDGLDRRVLTVSKESKDGGRFRTINEALAKVEPGMTIRVLDDGIYEEQIRINRPDQHSGLVLEAAAGKKPTLRVPKDLGLVPPNRFCVGIVGVDHVTLRGFRIDEQKAISLIFLTGSSPGAMLEDLDLMGGSDGLCVEIAQLPLSIEEAPICIQNCSLRNSESFGVFVQARRFALPFNEPLPCANIVILNNKFFDLGSGVNLAGATQRTLVMGNRFIDCNAGIDFREFLPGGEDILVANNTFFRNTRPLRVWDEGNAGLKSENIRFQNNLVLAPLRKADLFFFDHKRGVFDNKEIPGDIPGLLNAWRFSHNWREISPPKIDDPDAKFWIPKGEDVLQKPIEIMVRKPSDPNFLRPAKNSPLATAGVSDAVLPSYVGAVPPEGVEAWDWSKTWEALVRKKQ